MKQNRGTKSKDYHDYVIKNGKFIGAFEEMYQKFEDPWHHGDATAVQYDMALYLIKRYKICAGGGQSSISAVGRVLLHPDLKRRFLFHMYWRSI